MKTNKLLNPLSLFFVGLFLGALSRLFDMYYPNLGEIFSQMSVWILLGTLIAIYSPTKKAAMRNILPFCIGMLLTYYATAMLTQGVYGWTFVIGWTIFAFLSQKSGDCFLKSLALESYLFRFCPVFCSLTVCAFMILPLMVC